MKNDEKKRKNGNLQKSRAHLLFVRVREDGAAATSEWRKKAEAEAPRDLEAWLVIGITGSTLLS